MCVQLIRVTRTRDHLICEVIGEKKKKNGRAEVEEKKKLISRGIATRGEKKNCSRIAFYVGSIRTYYSREAEERWRETKKKKRLN